MNNPCCSSSWLGVQIEQSRPGRERPFTALFLFFACFLAGSLASQRSLYSFLLARLQIEGMTLHFFNDVFLLYLAFEAA